jgi:hypothetical protein
VDAQWLTGDSNLLRWLTLAAMLLPALLILLSRHCRWYLKPVWIVASQLPWAFPVLYAWIWLQRYADTTDVSAPIPVEPAFGWWMLAFPWAVYLLFRATRRLPSPSQN